MAIKHIEDLDEFKKMLAEAKGLVVVDFTASWCKSEIVLRLGAMDA